MKKFTLILMAILLTLSSAVCSDDKGALEISQKYLETESENKAASEYGSLYELTDWLTPEMEYICPVDTSEREREYITYSTELGSGNRFGYISLKSGELFDICPDPLCEHSDDSGCKYTSLSGIIEVPTDEKTLYAAKTVYEADSRRRVLYLIDTETGEMTELYSRGFDSDVYCSLTLSCTLAMAVIICAASRKWCGKKQ